MTESDLIALIEQEERNCISSTSGELSEQRREAMQYYYGKPYGNEIEGRSQVVTTEVKDAVEGILPSLMAIFTSSEEIVRFEPQNQEDEEAAQQATDYINYIFTRLNNGFLTLYCLFKDALLQKNGYAKVYWEDYTDQSKETYEKLTDDELLLLSQDEELELEEQTSYQDEYAAQQIQAQLAQIPEGMPVPEIPVPMLHDVVFKKTKKYGKICIDPTPPEEILVSRGTPNELAKARFVEHRTQKMISQVREMGYDVPDDIADDNDADSTVERVERNSFDDAESQDTANGADPSTRRVWLCEAYLYVDFDGDGLAEYRKVTKIGKTLLDNVEFDSLPVIGGTAILMPHKHNGLSIHDLVGDIQLIKSTITRNLLDNAYVANNGRMVVLDGMVNMDDLLTSRPNGIVRTKAMGAVTRLDNPLLGAPFYNLLEYFDRMKTNRVGARDFGDAVAPDALNAKAHTAELVSNAAQERINLMARILAETVVKQLFWKILELVSKHQQKPQIVKLRGQWVKVDPREWNKKFNMTVTVGLGTGSQQTVINSVNMLANLAAGMMKAGFSRVVSEENAYFLGHLAAKATFPKDADKIFTNPATLPPPQPQPNPDLMKLELTKYKADMGDSQKRDKMAQDAQLEQMRQKLEADKVQFQAMVDRATQEQKQQSELIKKMVEQEQKGREKMMDALAQIRISKEQGVNDKENIALQGVVDSALEDQKHLHAKAEIALQPKPEKKTE